MNRRTRADRRKDKDLAAKSVDVKLENNLQKIKTLTAEIISTHVFLREEDKPPQKKDNSKTNTLSPVKEQENVAPNNSEKNKKENHKQTLSISLQYLALAISANRTRVHYGQKHFCVKHDKVVDKHHIDDCHLLKGKHHPTAFN